MSILCSLASAVGPSLAWPELAACKLLLAGLRGGILASEAFPNGRYWSWDIAKGLGGAMGASFLHTRGWGSLDAGLFTTVYGGGGGGGLTSARVALGDKPDSAFRFAALFAIGLGGTGA